MDTQDADEASRRRRRGRSEGAKRRQIIDGALRRFSWQRGFDAASMGEIAREAGVSKGTLYVYFKSKEELFEAIVEEQCGLQGEQIFNFDANDRDVEAVLTRLGDAFVRFMCRPRGISPLRTVIAIADRMPELGAKFYQSGPARGIASLQQLSRGQGGGRRAGAARLRGGRRPVHRRLPVDDLQADAVQLCRRRRRTRRSPASSAPPCRRSSRPTSNRPERARRRSPRGRAGEQKSQQSQSRKPGAKLEHRDDADVVGEQAEGGGRQPAEPERQAIEQPADEADAMRH